ncbi:MAG: AraC family transcriptional regulator [Planctomycetota bacterium]|nr:AraC family transcriptional regulator [Planctomycetota bacterium]
MPRSAIPDLPPVSLGLPEDLDGDAFVPVFSGGPMRGHRHRELELNLARRGRARLIEENRSYDLAPGSLVWLFPARPHYLMRLTPDFELWVLVFKPRLVRRVCVGPGARPLRMANPPPADGPYCKRLAPAAAARLDGLFEELRDARGDAPRFNAGLAYALLSAWEVHRDEASRMAGDSVHPAVERAARLIAEGRLEAGIEDLAAASGLSASRLGRLFKRQTGVPLSTYRNQERIRRFGELYGGGQRTTMLRAALAAGFGSYTQFHRVFTALTGQSPQAWRRTRS